MELSAVALRDRRLSRPEEKNKEEGYTQEGATFHVKEVDVKF